MSGLSTLAKTRNRGRYNGNGRHWATPPEVYDPLHAEFGFTLDPCATSETTKCATYYTEDDDGLVQDWGSHVVFMNPPYGAEIYAWVRKARASADRGATVVGLLPASTDLAWWHEHIVGRAEVRYLRGRVRFLTDRTARASGFFASVIVIWRPPMSAHNPYAYDLVSIDPGRRTGVACWRAGALVRAYVVSIGLGETAPVRELPEADAAVVELPQAWGRVPAQDLITLAWIAGACSARYTQVVPVPPVKWRRGNMPKAIIAQRIIDRLRPEEREIVDAAAQGGGHAVDAVGIGLWALGRYP